MAFGPTTQKDVALPPLTGGSPPVYMPPKRLVFASSISNTVGVKTLSRAEIDQAIRQHGTNIAVMVDVGGTIPPHSQAEQMLRYIKERGVKHIGIYTEGRTGPTGSSYEAGEAARKEAAKRTYRMSESQWMKGGWERQFHDQIRHFAKNYGATFFEADNIPSGQTVRFLKSFQEAKNRGELPPHVQMLMKNPTHGEINELRTALANGSVKRESVADFAISEEFMRSSWPSLKKGLAEFGIQLACSHDTHNYAAKETYDTSLLGALGKFLKGAAQVALDIITAPFRAIASLFETPKAKPDVQSPQRFVPHAPTQPTYAQPHPDRTTPTVLRPVQAHDTPSLKWNINGDAPKPAAPKPIQETPAAIQRWTIQEPQPARRPA